MEFILYCAEEAFQFCFYQIPKELFTNEYYKGKLSSDVILLYALLLDRLSVSRKRGWIDENGHIFLIFTRKHAEEMLILNNVNMMIYLLCMQTIIGVLCMKIKIYGGLRMKIEYTRVGN